MPKKSEDFWILVSNLSSHGNEEHSGKPDETHVHFLSFAQQMLTCCYVICIVPTLPQLPKSSHLEIRAEAESPPKEARLVVRSWCPDKLPVVTIR